MRLDNLVDFLLDHLVGTLGVLLSVVGIVLSINAQALIWGLSILGLGLALLVGSVWYTYFRKAYREKHASQRWKFKDPGGELVEVTRIATYKINSKNLTAFQTKGMRTTGDYSNFESNIGNMNVKKTATGRGATGMDIQLHLEEPRPVGSELTWIAKFDNTNAFDEAEEGISFIAVDKVASGEIIVEFHEDRFPTTVDKVISSKGEEENVGALQINNSGCPVVHWRFKPKVGHIYTFAWRWPTVPEETNDSA